MTTPTQEDWFDPEATTFGDRLAGAREAVGMTQKELAQRLGVKLKTLKCWEEDLAEPRANKLSMMSGLLNVSLPWLLSGQGDGPDGPAEDDLDQDLKSMMAEIRALRAQVIGTAERLGRLEKNLRRTMQNQS